VLEDTSSSLYSRSPDRGNQDLEGGGFVGPLYPTESLRIRSGNIVSMLATKIDSELW